VAGTLTAELRTAHLPPVAFDLAELGGPAEEPSALKRWFLGWLRPELVVVTPLGTYRRAPYGDPGETTWPLLGLAIVGGAVLLVVFTVVGLVSLVRR